MPTPEPTRRAYQVTIPYGAMGNLTVDDATVLAARMAGQPVSVRGRRLGTVVHAEASTTGILATIDLTAGGDLETLATTIDDALEHGVELDRGAVAIGLADEHDASHVDEATDGR